MGGKVWSKEEEEVFWTRMMVQSPKRLAPDQERFGEKSWDQIAREMTKIMGDKARRKYTGLGIFEHYFQNAGLGRFSPNAGRLPLKYYRAERELKKERNDTKKSDPAPAPKDEEDGGIRKRKTHTTRRHDPPVDSDSLGSTTQSPIPASYQEQPLTSSSTAPATVLALPNPPSRYLIRRQYYLDRFLANHGWDAEDDMFVAQENAAPRRVVHEV
ncbi:hypothetical protein MFIFM68171_04456 [Madurella fahalii]|uniref:Myb-like domain-containing protein n=1 Tax=Madurella fahalii TaxID=1157608 RepID=A0ABQ0G939_9PEZI